jgi:hypothetical protein
MLSWQLVMRRKDSESITCICKQHSMLQGAVMQTRQGHKLQLEESYGTGRCLRSFTHDYIPLAT